MIEIAGLKGALGYVRAYRGRAFVIKLGGEILGDARATESIVGQIGLLHSLGIRVVVVHGGGPQTTALSRKLGHEPVVVAGRRVTDDAQLSVVKMALAGSVHVDLLAAFRRSHVPAVGVTGIDAELLTANRRPPVLLRDDGGNDREVDFGHVGDVVAVDPSILETLLHGGFLPVVASLAGDGDGAVFNVNADTVAEKLAVAIRAAKLVILTGTAGLLRDRDDPETLVSFADRDEIERMIASGAIAGGMRPKVEACLSAAERGVARTHILDGRAADALLLEVFTGAGCGTMIVARREQEALPDAAPAR